MARENSVVRFRIIIIIIATVIAGIVVGIIVYSNSPSQKLKKQLDLGQKYLNELKYEQAIVAFKEVLEISPQNEEAKELLVQAYLDWAEDLVSKGDTDSAISVLEKGYAFLSDDRLRYLLEEINSKRTASDSDTATDDADSKEKNKEDGPPDDLVKMFDHIIELVDRGDYEAANSYINAEKSIITKTGWKSKSIIYGEESTKLELIPSSTDSSNIYVGEILDNKRHGHGVLFRVFYSNVSATKTEVWFESDWNDNLPNGSFTLVEHVYDESGNEFSCKTYEGTTVNGLYEGKGTKTEVYPDYEYQNDTWIAEFHEGLGIPQTWDRPVDDPILSKNEDGDKVSSFPDYDESTVFGLFDSWGRMYNW